MSSLSSAISFIVLDQAICSENVNILDQFCYLSIDRKFSGYHLSAVGFLSIREDVICLSRLEIIYYHYT